MREQTLDRLIKIGLEVIAAGIVIAAAVYFLDRPSSTPTLVGRQIAAGEQAVRQNPTNVGLRLELAEVYRTAGKQATALEQYNQVLKIEQNQTALLGRGEILSQQGELSGAQKSFEAVIGKSGKAEYSAVNPQLESAHYGMAVLLMKQHQAKAALSEAKKALKIEPTDADAWYVMGTAAYGSGNYDQAVKAFQQAVLFVPSGWCQPYEQLVKTYQAQQHKPQAEYALAMVALCEKKPAAAMKRLEGLTSGPVAVDAMLGLGMAAEQLSQRANAIQWYKRVLTVDPGNFNARGGLTRLGGQAGGT
jgi:tetratricopeptide (TPR) repeat protein